MEAVSTGLPVSASTCETAGSDGICTQADSTITSASATFMPATMPGSLAGSWRPTSRLSGISSARQSTISNPSAAM
ncbi:hypothetical protein D3C78_1772390 [compost metagenome]